MTRAVYAAIFVRARARARTLVMAAALVLSGCAEIAIGAGATTGVGAFQERGLEVAARDVQLEAKIISQWLTYNDTLLFKIGIEVYEGRALLTGSVDGDATRADAMR